MKVCPHCNVRLVKEHDFDHEFTFKGLTVSFFAECPNCKKSFTWENHYVLAQIGDIEEEED